jgi:hypothetical protein
LISLVEIEKKWSRAAAVHPERANKPAVLFRKVLLLVSMIFNLCVLSFDNGLDTTIFIVELLVCDNITF